MTVQAHIAAWQYGVRLFDLGLDLLNSCPSPVGLMIGEKPGKHTDPAMPLFPHPETSSGARLLGYSDLRIEDFLGKITRENLWPTGVEDPDITRMRVEILKRRALQDDLRVLLLGKRVRDAFGCSKDFGLATLTVAGKRISVGWIPLPDRITDQANCRLAGSFARWAAGERKPVIE